MLTRLCIYCEREKAESEFSLEHIFPDRLGGKLCSELFKTRNVCQRCNSLMGLFVDGLFIKNWFRINCDASSAREYLDINSPNSIEPLVYMGRLKSIILPDGEVCEVWLGPCGSRNYHFHAADEERFKPYAGGDPIKRNADPGRVYLFLTSENPLWYGLSLRSFVAAFPESKRFAGNFGISNDPSTVVLPPDEIATAHLALLNALGDNEHNCESTFKIGFEGRWLAKLAIGLGTNILGFEFLSTSYAKTLHLALWEQDPIKRAEIPVRGTGFLTNQNEQADAIVGWPGAYTLHLHAASEFLILTVHLPNQRSLSIVISDEPSLWSDSSFDQYRNGQVYLVLPLMGRFIGPIQLGDYLGHRLKASSLPELTELEARRTNPSKLPPCR